MREVGTHGHLIEGLRQYSKQVDTLCHCLHKSLGALMEPVMLTFSTKAEDKTVDQWFSKF